MKIGFLLHVTVLIFWSGIDKSSVNLLEGLTTGLPPQTIKKSNTDKMLLLSGEYRIRTDDPLTASQML